MVEDYQENYISGWIKLHRSIINHWIFQDELKFKAWITILCEVNHKPKKLNIGNLLLNCDRGESLNSLETWANIFGKKWNKSKVRRFFDLLEKDNMIEIKNEQKTTRLTVRNYCVYQDLRNDNETQTKRKRNANETQTTPNKNDNNVNNEKNDNNNIYSAEFLEYSFDDFWSIYPNKVNKKKAMEKFAKLKPGDKKLIEHHLPIFINNPPFKDYKYPHAVTYLNQERFKDEIQLSDINLKSITNERFNQFTDAVRAKYPDA